MREILFRGKRADNGEWVYGNLIQNTDRSFIALKVEYSDIEYCYECDRPFIDDELYPIITETLGQFVEMEDTSGTKIFEGDRVNIITSNHVGNTCITRVTVSFDDLHILNAINYSHEVYIIGNVHELLEV